MSEDRKQIEAALDRLAEQLDRSTALDPAAAARSQELLADLRQALAQASPATQAPPSPAHAASEASLTERVSEAALEFEATHPTLSGTLGSIIDALGRMGI